MQQTSTSQFSFSWYKFKSRSKGIVNLTIVVARMSSFWLTAYRKAANGNNCPLPKLTQQKKPAHTHTTYERDEPRYRTYSAAVVFSTATLYCIMLCGNDQFRKLRFHFKASQVHNKLQSLTLVVMRHLFLPSQRLLDISLTQRIQTQSSFSNISLIEHFKTYGGQ